MTGIRNQGNIKRNKDSARLGTPEEEE